MQCLRIVSHNMETSEQTRNIRIPIAVVKIMSRWLPPSAFRLLDERIDERTARDILQALPKIADEVAALPASDGLVSGLIAEIEERRGVWSRGDSAIQAARGLMQDINPTSASQHNHQAAPESPQTWIEHTRIYIE